MLLAVSVSKGLTSQWLMPLGVASSEVWGEKTLMPFAESERRERWIGSERVKDFRPRKI